VKKERTRAKNRYKICDDYTILYLDRRDGSQMESLIDTEDLERVIGFKHKWHVTFMPNSNSYYVVCTIYLGMDSNGKSRSTTLSLHNFIMNCPSGKNADHISVDKLDNRKSNLRIAEDNENDRNRKGKNKNNTSNHRNVSLNKRTNQWMVQLQDKNGKNRCWKRFPYEQLEEAAKYAEFKRQELYGEYAGRD
jgi:hypothetical protein